MFVVLNVNAMSLATGGGTTPPPPPPKGDVPPPLPPPQAAIAIAAANAAMRFRIDIIRSAPSLVSWLAARQRTAAFSVTTFGVRKTSNSVRFADFVLVLNRLPR
jgi:hypothetical protein